MKHIKKAYILSFVLLVVCGCCCRDRSQLHPQTQEQYYLYWLTKPDLGEYVDLLISKKPILNLESLTVDIDQASLDSIAIIARTYMKDSIWNVDLRPFKSVLSVRSVDPEKKTIVLTYKDILSVTDKQTMVLKETSYKYESAHLADVISLLENPIGTIPIHRIYAPVAGAEELTRQLLAKLKK